MPSLQQHDLERQARSNFGYPLMQVFTAVGLRPQGNQTWESVLKFFCAFWSLILLQWDDEHTPVDGQYWTRPGERPSVWDCDLQSFRPRLVFPSEFNRRASIVSPLQLPLEHQRQTGDPRMIQFYPPSLWLGRDMMINHALFGLQRRGIPVVEYGGQLLHRLVCQDPEEVRCFEAMNTAEYHMQYIEWAIPDEQMQLAADAIRFWGFGEKFRTDTKAYKLINGTAVPNLGWDSNVKILAYKFPRESMEPGDRDVLLYLIPLSATGLEVTDTWEMYSTFDPHHALHTPIPPRYIHSLMRILNDRTRDDPGRHRFESDLIKAINGVLIDKGYAPFVKKTPEHDMCVQEAIGALGRWVEDGLWPKGKEEDLEVLKALINDLDLVRWMYRDEDTSSGGRVLGEVA